MTKLLPRFTNDIFVSSLFAILVISNYGFEDIISLLIVPVPGHCLHFLGGDVLFNSCS